MPACMASKRKPMKEHDMDKDAKEHGHLKVTNVSMVSDSCKK
jgi:hypothetical protein